MELSVIVPCINEEANVPELVTRVAHVFDDRRWSGVRSALFLRSPTVYHLMNESLS